MPGGTGGSDFNPLHREGGDAGFTDALLRTAIFQSTPPRGWRLYSGNRFASARVFQSTPPRGWRRRPLPLSLPPIPISIHSTARVETHLVLHPVHAPEISIHSTARVETTITCTAVGILPKFQSTPPRGWRPRRGISSPSLARISIHSTARVETCGIHAPYLGGCNFNPLHREGGDRDAIVNVVSLYHFNPLHREGGDEGSSTS